MKIKKNITDRLQLQTHTKYFQKGTYAQKQPLVRGLLKNSEKSKSYLIKALFKNTKVEFLWHDLLLKIKKNFPAFLVSIVPPEIAVHACSTKQLLLRILQKSYEDTYTRGFFISKTFNSNYFVEQIRVTSAEYD